MLPKDLNDPGRVNLTDSLHYQISYRGYTFNLAQTLYVNDTAPKLKRCLPPVCEK
jgi:hypothetical protein